MSTKITEIYTALVDLIRETLPEHKRLTNVEEIEDNDATLLRQGWGLKIGGGANTNDVICPQYNLERKFLVTITREYLAKGSDADRREASKLLLLEDLHLVLAEAVRQIQLEGPAIGIAYEDDGGPEEFTLQDKPFHMIEATFTVKYFQLVSGG